MIVHSCMGTRVVLCGRMSICPEFAKLGMHCRLKSPMWLHQSSVTKKNPSLNTVLWCCHPLWCFGLLNGQHISEWLGAPKIPHFIAALYP